MKKLALGLLVIPALSLAESSSPYIDQMKREMKAAEKTTESSAGYTEQLREKIKPDPQSPSSENYSEKLRNEIKAADRKNEIDKHGESKGYTEQQRAYIEPQESGGAIAALKEGRSELHARKPGRVHGAFGFRFAASQSRTLNASTSSLGHPYQDVYGNEWTPDLNLFYEMRPFHHDWLGSMGLVVNAGASFKRAQGLFGRVLTAPDGSSFGNRAQTKFTFITVPVSIGPIYHFHLLKWLQPYAEVAPSAIGYFETRDDEKKGHRGYSSGLYAAVGVGIPLDFLDEKSGWSLYETAGVKHFFLNIEYSRLSTLSGEVRFTVSGLSAGLGYEF